MAMFHGISGIIFVLVIRFILESNIIKNLEKVTNITQIISYSLISCLGLFIVVSAVNKIIKKQEVKKTPESRKYTNPVLLALVVGGIPCPGVVMLMLFALSMDMIGLGIILGISVSAGMALTVSLVVLIAISGKAASFTAISKSNKKTVFIESGTEIVGGLLLVILGALFLAANVSFLFGQ